MIPGRQELPDIRVPVVFHKPQQLLTIVLGEMGAPLTLPPIAFLEMPSLPTSNLVPDGGEMTARSKKGSSLA